MNKKLFLIVLAGLTLINLSAFGFWIYQKYRPRPARVRMIPHQPERPHLRMLHLTPEQARRFRESQRAFRWKADSISRKMRIARLTLMDELLSDQPDSSKIDSLLTQISKSQWWLEKLLVDHLLAQKEYLTPEQQVALFRMMEARLKGHRRMDFQNRLGNHPKRR